MRYGVSRLQIDSLLELANSLAAPARAIQPLRESNINARRKRIERHGASHFAERAFRVSALQEAIGQPLPCQLVIRVELNRAGKLAVCLLPRPLIVFMNVGER